MSAQGPIVIEVNPNITVADLKVQVEKEFEIPVNVQKWILGKQLVSEDTVTLGSQGISQDGDKIYLYLVNPEEEKKEEVKEAPAAQQKIPLVLPTEPNQKGRYWNYEMERWSFCNSDDDEDRQEEIKAIDKDDDKKKEEGVDKEEEDEWEYYYDDVEIKPKEQEPKEPPVVAPAPKKVDGWECPMCTLVNPLERPGCSACTTERPADLGAVAVQQQEAKVTKQEAPAKEDKKNGLDMYKQLENLDIIPNAENFECTICYLDVEPGDGVVLRECLHTFCK